MLSGLLGGCASHQQSKDAARQRFEQTTARAKIPMAREFFENGKTDEAVTILTDCLRMDPDNPQAHLLMGEVQISLGRNDVARAHLLKAVELQDQLHAAWSWLGVIALEAKQPQQAIDYQRKALERDPLNVDYILNLAETTVSLEALDEAEYSVEREMPGFAHGCASDDDNGQSEKPPGGSNGSHSFVQTDSGPES